MASTIGDATNSELRIKWLGAFNEDANSTTTIGAADDGDIEQFVDDVDAVSRAGLPKVVVSAGRLVTGQSTTPVAQAADSQVNNMISLVFTQTHPLNDALTIRKSFQLRAPSGAVIGTNGALVVASVVGDRSSADESLRGVIEFLKANMTYEDITGAITVGGWTWDASASAYIAAPAVIDGQ